MGHEHIPPQVIEKWRSEFESLIPPNKYVKYDRDKNAYIPTTMEYSAMHYDGRWQGFLLARSTVVISIPKPDCTYADHSYPAYSRRAVCEMISDLGYRVAGEK